MRRERILDGLGGFIYQHPRVIALATVVATLAALLAIRGMPFDATFFSLFPKSNPDVDRFHEAVEEFGGSSHLLVLLETPGGGPDRDRLLACAEALAPSIADIDDVERVEFRIDTEFLETHGLIFLDPADLGRLDAALTVQSDAIAAVLAEPSVAGALVSINEGLPQTIGSAGGGDLRDAQLGLEALDALVVTIEDRLLDAPDAPIDAARARIERIVARWVGRTAGVDVATLIERGGYLLGPGDASLLLIVRLDADPLHSAFGFDLYDQVKEVADATAGQAGLSVGYAGHFAMGAEDQRRTLSKVQLLSFISLLLVIVTFVFLLRSRWAPLLVGLPLLLGVTWTFGLVRVVLGEMTLMSAVFGIALFGLGVDFAIHLLFRLGEELDRRPDLGEAIRVTLRTTGKGVITGGLTTALAFFGLNASEFRGAHHLGTTTGMGMICCVVAFVVVMPAMLVGIAWIRGSAGAPPIGRATPSAGSIDAIVGWVCRHPVVTLVVALLVTGGFATQLTRFELIYDLEKIIQQDLPSVATKHRVEEQFGLTSEFAMLAASDLEEADRFAKELRTKASISKVEGPSDLVPTDQGSRVPLARSIGATAGALLDRGARGPAPGAAPSGAGDPAAVADGLDRLARSAASAIPIAGPLAPDLLAFATRAASVAGRLRETPPASTHVAALDAEVGVAFGDALERLRPFAEATEFGFDDLPDHVKARYLGRTGRLVVLAYPHDARFSREAIDAFKADVMSVSEDGAALAFMVNVLLQAALETMPRTIAVVVVLVCLLLLVDLRSVRLTILAMVPLGFGAVVGFGATCVLSPVMSVLALGAFPLVFGIGIDDGVHLIHRFREDGGRDVPGAVAATGRAILFTSVTTAMSFGCLLFTNHPGLAGLGLTVSLGVLGCFVASITVLPAILQLGVGSSPGAASEEPSGRAA